jgi:hypothetical protein
MEYAVLCNPGHNRVYFDAARKMMAAELAVVSGKMAASVADAREERIGGVPYLRFAARKRLGAEDIARVSELSFLYALFEVEGDCLRPVARTAVDFVDESIGTILKYTGKTNEAFTRLLINLARYSLAEGPERRLLDPVAGKGTTLFEGLRQGLDVFGIEIGERVAGEAYHFLKRYLENAKYKHTAKETRVSGPNKAFTATRYAFEIARTKEALQAGDTRVVEVVAGNSAHAAQLYRKGFFDMIVGDLPYGVQHGNVTQEKQSALTRNPAQLLGACLPAWKAVLRPGGVVVMAWNTHVLPRARLEEIFEGQGFFVLREGPYLELEHRVDQAIQRDVVAARL